MTYCQHQREAVLLTCATCGQAYYVTNRGAPERFVCVWCSKAPASDVNGVPMEGGSTGP